MGKKKDSRDRNPKEVPRFRGDMVVSDIVDSHPRAKDVLEGFGLPCHRCVVAWHETLAEGCHPMGLDVERILESLNALDEE